MDRGSSSVWLERLPVTQKVASSSLVYPAIFLLTYIHFSNILYIMTETIIMILCLMLPSMIFGYCFRWMQDEERIAKQIEANKQKQQLEKEKLLQELS